MPRYDLVVHASVDLDGATPEQAATIFKGGLRAGVDPRAVVRGLAVWRPHDGATATPLPGPLPERLTHFFEGVARSAAVAEAAFRLEVEQIMAGGLADDDPTLARAVAASQS